MNIEELRKAGWVINRQGTDMVLYKGLLAMAHDKGVKALRTSIYQPPLDSNGQMAIVHATVLMADGSEWDGVGDATPGNVNRNIAPHILRMAETRAKARALRDALNIGVVAAEEMGDYEPDHAEPAPARQRLVAHSQQEAETKGEKAIRELFPDKAAAQPATPAPAPAAKVPVGVVQNPATQPQIRAIYAIARNQRGMQEEQTKALCADRYHKYPDELDKYQASDLITWLQGSDALPQAQ